MSIQEQLQSYKGGYYQVSSMDEGRNVVSFLENLGYKCYDGQPEPNATYWEWIVLNHAYENAYDYGPAGTGTYYFNGKAPSTLDSCEFFSASYKNFWDRNRFLDFAILNAPNTQLDMERYYRVETPRGQSAGRYAVNMIYAPTNLNKDTKLIRRLSTSWEVNLYYMFKRDMKYPVRYYDLLTNQKTSWTSN